MSRRPDLHDELLRLVSRDAEVRQRLAASGELFKGYHPEMRAVHRSNGDRLMAILDEVGCWPGRELVGDEGSQAAFLIAQHDIANPPLMRRARELYEAAVANGDAEPSRLAYLEDRIRAFEGRPQRYGTQVGWDETGQFGAWPPVEEPDRVDERRAEVGLTPLADALAPAQADPNSMKPAAEAVEAHRLAEDFAIGAGWRTLS